MLYSPACDLADDGVALAVTRFFKQACDKWTARPVSDRDYIDAHLINAAVDVHDDDPKFGYLFITDELSAQGWRALRTRVGRLCTLAAAVAGARLQAQPPPSARPAGARRPGAP